MAENIYSASFGSVMLQVSPEQLNSTADSVSQKISYVNNTFEKVHKNINSMLNYWLGFSAEDNVSNYNKQGDNINNMIHNLKLYVDELKQISSNYASTESAIAAAASELPSNILE